MKVTYDPNNNIAYIRFRSKAKEIETLQISEEINIDIAADGCIFGIELLNARKQLFEPDNGGLSLVNVATGEAKELSFTF